MSFEGTLEQVDLEDVLRHLADDRATGILTLQNEREILAVTFQRGEIVGADSLNQGEEGLGEQLALEGLVAPYEFAAVLAAHRTGGGRVTDLLLERGSIERRDLLGALRRHTLRLLQQVIAWRQGSYKFYMGEEVAFEEGFAPIAVEELGTGGTDSAARPAAGLADLGVEFEPGPGLDPAAEPTRPPVFTRRENAAGRLSTGFPAPLPGESWKTLIPPEPGLPAAPVPASSADRGWSSETAPRREGLLAAMRPSLPALLALLLAGAWFLWRPVDLLGGLPWTVGGARSFETARRIAAFQKVDSAARVFFLVEGRYPASIAELVAQAGLQASAAKDPSGRNLELAAGDLSYVLSVVDAARGDELSRTIESVAGDLFLDANLFHSGSELDDKPLILLD